MSSKLPVKHKDLIIIGTGMTGMAAAVFAANRGIDTVLVGVTGELNFASGLFDLLGVHPIESGRVRQNPWEAIAELRRDCPRHPYALLDQKDMRAAFNDCLEFLKQAGLGYRYYPEHNQQLITPVGTIKTTYAVPETAYNGVRALAERADCLIVDFHGLKGFSGRQMVESLKSDWPALKTRRLDFPDARGELYPEHMARSMEVPQIRQRLADAIGKVSEPGQYIGLPTILGIYRTKAVFADLAQRLQRPLFEIPTMLPSVSGQRLLEVFQRELPQRGIRTYFQHKVLQATADDRSGFRFLVGAQQPDFELHTRGAILASGRFFGKGLAADRRQVRETVFDIPIAQPKGRTSWHQKKFLDPAGHRINRVGIDTDESFRPVKEDGQSLHANLFAAGSILAHQDWMRMKCGSGLAITTAYAAVKAFSGANAP